MKPAADRILLTLSALALATLLWFIVGAEERSEIVVSVPLEYRNIPKDHELSTRSEMVTDVNVWVRGNTANIKDLQPNRISVWIDLQNARLGQESYDIEVENVRVPYGFSVLRISPSQIRLRLERVVRRLVPVQPYFQGAPSAGFAVSQFSVSPPQVEIIGPQSTADSIRQVLTEPIDLTNKKGTIISDARVALTNNSVHLGTVKDVRVTARISEIEDIRTVGHVRLTLAHPGPGLDIRFTPKLVRIEIQAPRTLLEKIDVNKISAILDLQELGPGIYDLTPQVIVDAPGREKIGIKSITPPRIHVRIQ